MSDEREIFKSACLGLIPCEQIKSLLGEQRAKDLQWIVTNKCRGCGAVLGADDFAIWNTYWSACWAPCHKGCREEGMKREAIECQTLDADCNDCRFFKRGERIMLRIDEKPDGTFREIFQGSFHGECLKFNRPTTAHVNFSTGRECFEHRRGIVTSS